MNDDKLILHKEKSIPSDDYMKVKEGLDFILRHFEPNILFPRTIMTKKIGYQRIVFSKEETLRFFKDSGYIDCRINAFPCESNYNPNFIFIDLDDSGYDEVSIAYKLQSTLSNIQQRLNGIPTILSTGNGYHIYQPLESSVSFRDIIDLNDFRDAETLFLKFSKNFLSNGYADSSNNPSLKSCLLRIPNSFNSKSLVKRSGAQQGRVRVVNLWDYKRPSIGNLMGSFYAYLISQKIRSETKRVEFSPHNNAYSNAKIKWIEKLLQTPLEDYRKYCIFHILVPYLVNVKELPPVKVSQVIVNWLSKCNTVRPLDFDPTKEIKNRIKYVRDFKPMSLAKLHRDNNCLYRILTAQIPNCSTILHKETKSL